jgi:tRNA pseudouridine38-40 synthase
MQRHFFHISYLGTHYHGWQKVPQNHSLQFVIEKQLSRVIKKPVEINGCGRTDTGVHASQYFFHVDLEEQDLSELKFKLNQNLPDDIAVFDILPMQGQPHARLDAVERTYDYFIHFHKDPFLDNVSSYYDRPKPDLQGMREATSLLTRYNDYRYFYRTASKVRTTISNVSSATLFVNADGDRLKFSITANRFLAGMIRIIVHRMMEIARGKMTVEEFESYLKGTSVPINVRSAYPQGLFLSRVKYPFLDIPPQSKFDQLINQNVWQSL